MFDYDILFLGKLFPKEEEKMIFNKSRNNMQDAANAFQWKIVSGMESNMESPMQIFNMIPIGSYPKNYDDMFVKETSFEHIKGAKDINIGFLNLCYIKHFIREFYLKPHVARWTKKVGVRRKVIISYTLDAAYLKSIKKAKIMDPSIITCAIVPDLPLYTNLSKNLSPLLKLYIKFNNIRLKKLLNYIDSYVLITEQMKDELPPNKPYQIIEAIAEDIFDKSSVSKTDDNIRTILYTGTLHQKFGILHLLEAFSMIKDEKYRLVICGIGDSEKRIEEMAKLDSRIDFRGQVSRGEALRLQCTSTVLVNPRLNNEVFTRYSFPSKTMEYLASGTPVVSYKLDGIPDEYDKYITYVPDEKVESLRDTLISVCEKDAIELKRSGQKSRKFVLENKNNLIQTKKIFKLIEQVKKMKNSKTI